MKKLLFLMVLLGLMAPARSQEKAYDTLAIVVLDHMSAIIGDLTSCRFRLDVEQDLSDPDCERFTRHEFSTVWFSGPGRMLVETNGDKGHRGFWYNGRTLTWYSFSENNYVVIPAPSRTIDMIDSLNQTYGIDFPAADILSPTLSDDLIRHSDFISFQGRTMIGKQSCFQIVARSTDWTVQFWITDDLLFLPLKIMVAYHKDSQARRYEATFSDWELNPQLPDAIFEFAIPPGAHEVSILPRK